MVGVPQIITFDNNIVCYISTSYQLGSACVIANINRNIKLKYTELSAFKPE